MGCGIFAPDLTPSIPGFPRNQRLIVGGCISRVLASAEHELWCRVVYSENVDNSSLCRLSTLETYSGGKKADLPQSFAGSLVTDVFVQTNTMTHEGTQPE
ncbi:hypothetical protein CBL_11960 [Carabus blaptoides fortunei]